MRSKFVCSVIFYIWMFLLNSQLASRQWFTAIWLLSVYVCSGFLLIPAELADIVIERTFNDEIKAFITLLYPGLNAGIHVSDETEIGWYQR